MPVFLLKLFTNVVVQKLVVFGLETIAKRTDNTVDDEVIAIVRTGLANRLNPVTRVTGE